MSRRHPGQPRGGACPGPGRQVWCRRIIAVLAAMAGIFVALPDAAGYRGIAPRQCPDGARWPDSRLPVDYRVHEDGSRDISDRSALVGAVRAGFDAWQSPCCSGFDAGWDGTTDRTALDSRRARDDRVVVSWRQKKWPAQLGAPSLTVAVGSPTIDQCRIVDATLLFNDRYQRFSTQPERGELDVQSVVTHETGHLLGLGHSAVSEATMYHEYRGGTRMRTLAEDDIDGVCSLYETPDGSCTCESDGDCFAGTTCVDGTCRDVPCRSDAACGGVRVCDAHSGDCRMPNCSRHADCPEQYTCNSEGRCIPSCTVCRRCETSSDCGATGQCVDFDGGRCIVPCAGGECPGDAVCQSVRAVSGRTYQICLNPDAGSGQADDICPDDWVCGQSTGGDVAPDAGGSDTGLSDAGGGGCPSLGTSCTSSNQSACGADSDGCMLLASGRQICTCRCETHTDCGPEASCVTLPNGAWCVPDRMQNDDRCEGMKCDDSPAPDAGRSQAGSDDQPRVAPKESGGCRLHRDGDPVPLPFVIIVVMAGLGARSRRPRK